MKDRGLSPQRERFALEVASGKNQADAHRAAYPRSQKWKDSAVWSAASRLMADSKVSARVDQLRQAAESAAVMTRQEALERLSRFARADLADLVEFGTHELGEVDGEPVIQSTWRIKDSVLQDPAALSAIAELNASKDGIKIKTHSPLQAIQQLAKMQGWESAQKHEHSGPNGSPIAVAPMTKAEYQEARKEMLEQDDC